MTRPKRRGSLGRWVVLVLCSAGAAALGVACARKPALVAPAPLAPTPTGAAALVPPDAAKADLAQLYETLGRAHFDLDARVSKPDYDRVYVETLRSLDRPASRTEVATTFERFVAFGKVAHARIDAIYDASDAYQAAGGKVLPLSIREVRGRVFVTENLSGDDEIHPGDELVALNGQPIAAWLARVGRDVSADTPYMAHTLLERDFPALVWLEVGPAETFAVTLRRGMGDVIERTIPARAAEEMRAIAERHPPRLTLDRKGRSQRILAHGIAYLRPGPFYNNEPGAKNEYDNASFTRFIDAAFQSFMHAEARALVIDLRDNPGGDSSFSDRMVAWFASRPFRFESAFKIKVSAEALASNQKRVDAEPAEGESVSRKFAAAYAGARPGDVITFDTPGAAPRPEPRFSGRVYVLVNRRSYSNTVAVAALVQDYGFGKVIGEETSDLATTYGAMETFTLGRTGLEVGFPKAFIVRPNGSLTPRGVVPDIAIETPVVEGVEDPVLEAAVRIAEEAK